MPKNRKKLLIIICSIISILYIVLSSVIENVVENKPKIVMDSIPDISMKILGFTQEIITIQIIDHTNRDNTLWTNHKIEKKTDKGWQEIKRIYPLVKGSSTSLPGNNILTVYLDLQSEYGELENGFYRIVGEAEMYEYAQPYEFSVEFEVPYEEET